MRLDDLPVTGVRSPLVARRAEFLALLAKLKSVDLRGPSSVYWDDGGHPHHRDRLVAADPGRRGLEPGRRGGPAASATLTMTGDTAWRFLTGARYAPESVARAGLGSLLAPLLRVRGVIA
jgi:hypothetical protein